MATTITTTSTLPRSSTKTDATTALQNSNLTGSLEYPDNLAITVPFTSASGVAGMEVTWDGSEQLSATLHCPGDTASQSGTGSISLSVSGQPGNCHVSIALVAASRHGVRYSLRLFAPGA